MYIFGPIKYTYANFGRELLQGYTIMEDLVRLENILCHTVCAEYIVGVSKACVR